MQDFDRMTPVEADIVFVLESDPDVVAILGLEPTECGPYDIAVRLRPFHQNKVAELHYRLGNAIGRDLAARVLFVDTHRNAPSIARGTPLVLDDDARASAGARARLRECASRSVEDTDIPLPPLATQGKDETERPRRPRVFVFLDDLDDPDVLRTIESSIEADIVVARDCRPSPAEWLTAREALDRGPFELAIVHERKAHTYPQRPDWLPKSTPLLLYRPAGVPATSTRIAWDYAELRSAIGQLLPSAAKRSLGVP